MIEVITSITGGKDNLIEDQKIGNAKFTAYSDKSSSTWEVRRPYTGFADPRRNSRIQKLLIHQYTKAKISIWIDGNIRLLRTPEELVEKYLQDYDMAVFKHPRNCLYEEAKVCALGRLDDPELIIEQVKHYEEEGFAKQKGLGECHFIIRRMNEKTEAFDNAWWSEYCRFSRRDQISFMYAADKVGINLNLIPEQYEVIDGRYIRGGSIEIVPHLHFEGNIHGK